MSMRDDVARYEKAGLNAQFHWWDYETAKTMLDGLADALAVAGEKGYLIARPGLREDGRATLWLTVEGGSYPKGEGGGTYNDSFPCPPWCPDDNGS